MTSLNLDGVGQWWVAALARFNMTIEYQNNVADILSWVGGCLEPEAVTELVNQVKHSNTTCTKVEHPQVLVSGGDITDAAGGQKLCNLRDTNLVITQQTDLVLKHISDWLKQCKDDQRSLNNYLKNYTADLE